jgi:hypothetical protein
VLIVDAKFSIPLANDAPVPGDKHSVRDVPISVGLPFDRGLKA